MNAESPNNGSSAATTATILDETSVVQIVDSMKLKLAAMHAPRRWRGHVLQLSEMVRGGTALENAVAQTDALMPSELSALVREAISLPDPARFLADTLVARENVRRGWNQLMSICIYPTLLFLFALCIGVAFSLSMQQLVGLDDWVRDLGINMIDYSAIVQDQHQAILGMAIICGWLVVVMATIYFVGPPWAWVRIVGGIVVVGKPLRWLCLQEILLRYRILVEQGVQTGDIVDRVAASFRNSHQSRVTVAIAGRIKSGVPIGRSLGASSLTDGLCRPSLLMIDHARVPLHQSLDQTARVLGAMVEQRCRTLATIIPLFVLASVGTIVWGALASYYMSLAPLIALISALA